MAGSRRRPATSALLASFSLLAALLLAASPVFAEGLLGGAGGPGRGGEEEEEVQPVEEGILAAARKGRVEEVDQFLADNASSVLARDTDGSTPLHWAARKGRLPVALALLAARAPLEARTPAGRTPLHEARGSIAEQLLISRASFSVRDATGATPLHVAARFGFVHPVAALLSARADVGARDKKGNTPLHRADNSRVAELLIEHRANAEAIDKAGQSPLHTVAAKGAEGAAEVLLRTRVDIQACDFQARTPLHLAKGAEVTKLLLDHGAPIDAIDQNERTPLHWAAMQGHVGAVKTLLAYNASAFARDTAHFQPRDFALSYNYPSVASLLPRVSEAQMIRDPSFWTMIAVVCLCLVGSKLVPESWKFAVRGHHAHTLAPSRGALHLAMQASSSKPQQYMAQFFRFMDAFVTIVLPMRIMLHIKPMIWLPFLVASHLIPRYFLYGGLKRSDLQLTNLATTVCSTTQSLHEIRKFTGPSIAGLGLNAVRVAFYILVYVYVFRHHEVHYMRNRRGGEALHMIQRNPNMVVCFDPLPSFLQTLDRVGWHVTEGNCTVDREGCLSSPGFPGPYPVGQECLVEAGRLETWRVDVRAFGAEEPWDYFRINGFRYTGKQGPQGLVPVGRLRWRTREQGLASAAGFRLCPRLERWCVNVMKVRDMWHLTWLLSCFCAACWLVAAAAMVAIWARGRLLPSSPSSSSPRAGLSPSASVLVLENAPGEETDILALAEQVEELSLELQQMDRCTEKEKARRYSKLRGSAGPVRPFAGFTLRHHVVPTGVYVDAVFIVMDLVLDFFTVNTLLLNGNYAFAFVIILAVTYSMVDECRSGTYGKLCSEVPIMLKTGVPSTAYLLMLDRERCTETLITLAVTCYGLPFATKTPFQGLTGIASIFTSLVSYSMHMHRKLDLALQVRSEESLPGSASPRSDPVDDFSSTCSADSDSEKGGAGDGGSSSVRA